MEESFSIAICTYRRFDLIELCLKKLIGLMERNQIFPQILIIDNDEKNLLKSRINNYLNKFNSISLFVEKNLGLSHARNLAVEKCKTKYLAFIDDDAYPENNYLKRLKDYCDNLEFDVLGGSQIPYSIRKVPGWFPSGFSKNWASGFNIVFKVNTIIQIGGFNKNLGMKGTSIGYGEEILPQVLIKGSNGKILMIPELKVHHFINPYKLSKRWQYRSSFCRGRDSWLLFNKSRPSNRDLIFLFKEIIFSIKGVKLFYDFSSINKFCFELGRFYGGIVYKKDIK